MNFRRIKSILNKNQIDYFIDYDLTNLNTLKINSMAKIFIKVDDVNVLQKLIKVLNINKIKYFVLGNGSNVLFVNKIIKKVVIKLNFLDDIKRINNYVLVTSSTSNLKLQNYLYNNSLKGFEFASLIPGSIGGGVYSNASCYNRSFEDIVKYVEVIDEFGNRYWLNNKLINFGYRTSIFKNEKLIICRVIFGFSYAEKSLIFNEVKRLFCLKNNTQPLTKNTCGSVFKNSYLKAYFLIRSVGLANYNYKGVCFSNKHANFIENNSNASGKTIYKLVQLAKRKVLKKYKIILEEEIVIVKNI